MSKKSKKSTGVSSFLLPALTSWIKLTFAHQDKVCKAYAEDDEDVWGFYDNETQEVWVANNLRSDQQAQTIMHELAHVIYDQMRYAKFRDEEQKCELIAHMFCTIIGHDRIMEAVEEWQQRAGKQ